MKFYYLTAEVPGNTADSIFIDRFSRPQKIESLKYEFEGWLGDDIIESIGTYLVTSPLKAAMEEAKLTGATFDVAEIVRSEQFIELYGDKQLPPFHWVKVDGRPFTDDLAISDACTLLISEKALSVLKQFHIENAEITEATMS